ncbi:MAG: hypothetical protein CMB80_09395, partial [Flammeovirgaceae bacterium]|nr:hypothetical protein [Flammeovirgaceae bacterium]
PSGNPDSFILDDLSQKGDAIPGSEILGEGGTAAVDSTDANALVEDEAKTVSLGGAVAGKPIISAPAIEKNPFTGKKMDVPLESSVTTVKGEATYKDLATGEVLPEFKGLIPLEI